MARPTAGDRHLAATRGRRRQTAPSKNDSGRRSEFVLDQSGREAEDAVGCDPEIAATGIIYGLPIASTDVTDFLRIRRSFPIPVCTLQLPADGMSIHPMDGFSAKTWSRTNETGIRPSARSNTSGDVFVWALGNSRSRFLNVKLIDEERIRAGLRLLNFRGRAPQG